MIRRFNKEADYSTFKSFSEAHKWPVIPPELIPRLGFVSCINGAPACFVFLYETIGTPWVVMEWMMVDRYLPKAERGPAIDECIQAVQDHVRENKLVLFTSCKSAKLNHRYLQAGFSESDKGMTNFIFKG